MLFYQMTTSHRYHQTLEGPIVSAHKLEIRSKIISIPMAVSLGKIEELGLNTDLYQLGCRTVHVDRTVVQCGAACIPACVGEHASN